VERNLIGAVFEEVRLLILVYLDQDLWIRVKGFGFRVQGLEARV